MKFIVTKKNSKTLQCQ